MSRIALNYLYLSEKHAGGKDQVGLNLLKGFCKSEIAEQIIIVCYDYSKETIQKIAPLMQIVTLSAKKVGLLGHILGLYYANTVIIPRIIKKYDIKVIYHLSMNNGLKKLKTTSIVTPHDIKQIAHRKIGSDKIPFYKYYPYKFMYYLDFKHADKIIAISEFDKQDIIKYYPQHVKKVIRIYNPIVMPDYIEKFEQKMEKNLVAINLQFLHKNIITLIKAFDLIKDKIEHNLILIGSVPKRVEFLKLYVKEKNLQDRVIFTNFIPDNEKYQILVNASLYINPSKFEGFGMTAVEAMLLKVPTLVSDIPVNREVTKGLCQYYQPIEDEKCLANKIFYCLKKERNINELQDNKKQIELEYNFISICGQYIKLFLKELEI